MNTLAARRFRRKGRGTMMGFNVLVLTTVGRRSGAARATPVGWFPGSGESWLIVASANITAAAPRFAKYQHKTDRELPIIRLTRTQTPPSDTTQDTDRR